LFLTVDDPVDVSTLRNGQVAQEDLVAAVGGDDFLLEGAPSNSWNAMVAAARADGVDITYGDAYRSLDHQHDVAERLGLFSQGGMAARPGTSNHGLGLAIDLDWSGEANRDTREWMLQNAAEYGWEQHSAAREAHHWTYREELDPDPDRWLGTGPDNGASGEERAAGHAFDRDGDGIYDAVEDYVAAQGHTLPGNEPPPDAAHSHDHGGDAAHSHSHGGGHVCSHGPGESCPECGSGSDEAEEATGCAHGPGESCPACESVGDDDAESLDPAVEPLGALSPDEMHGLDHILGRFELDATGELRFESLAAEEQVGLRDALSDLYAERVGGDRESFTDQFDEILSERNGDLELTEVLDLFDDF
jgi:hypothetical protein